MKTETHPESGGHAFKTVKEVEANVRTRMEKAISDLQHEMASIRTGRASLGILDHIRVDYYGTPTPLNQVANLHVPEPSLITIQPWDVTQIGPIEKAIRTSDLGLNPANDGKLIRLQVPTMSGEQRQKMVQRIKKSAEEAKVACRNIRRDGNKHFDVGEKEKEMTEDERDKGKEQVQALLKTFEDKIQEMADKKAKEIVEQ